MTPEEIKVRVDELRDYERVLTYLKNDIWEEKTNLRDQYKRITGKEI